VAERAGTVTSLADVIAGRGQNSRSLALRAYVLAVKLQQVAAVGTDHLRQMSGGRYSFVYSDERETHGRSGGLGLDVLDTYSGLVRPTKTLSGGESFLASLALALGLADVVTGDAGSRMLGTIFVDEGFGSLDSDTLETVMATLDELRAGGRVVGVVSHVDEMRQRIPTRLRVRKDVTGSTVEMTAR
jgi:exonuclease SbcC